MNEYKYYCEKCDYGTNIRHSLLIHNESTLHKTGERGKRPPKDPKTYQCKKCDYNTVNKNNYLTHLLNNHSSKKKRKEKFKYYCDKCDFGVFTESSYNKHFESKRHIRLHQD
jgi:hypothetical protein